MAEQIARALSNFASFVVVVKARTRNKGNDKEGEEKMEMIWPKKEKEKQLLGNHMWTSIFFSWPNAETTFGQRDFGRQNVQKMFMGVK